MLAGIAEAQANYFNNSVVNSTKHMRYEVIQNCCVKKLAPE